MKWLWRKTGNCLFWAGWPALWLYLRGSHRTRVLLTCGDWVLVTQPWLGSGKWILPGGGLHKGETSIYGGLRELEEETGIHLQAHQIKLHSTEEYNHSGLSFFYDLYFGKVPKPLGIKKQFIEIIDAQWINYKDLNSINAAPDVVSAIGVWFAKK